MSADEKFDANLRVAEARVVERRVKERRKRDRQTRRMVQGTMVALLVLGFFGFRGAEETDRDLRAYDHRISAETKARDIAIQKSREDVTATVCSEINKTRAGLRAIILRQIRNRAVAEREAKTLASVSCETLVRKVEDGVPVE